MDPGAAWHFRLAIELIALQLSAVALTLNATSLPSSLLFTKLAKAVQLPRCQTKCRTWALEVSSIAITILIPIWTSFAGRSKRARRTDPVRYRP